MQLTERLNELRQHAVQRIGRDLTESVQKYIPSVRSIELQTADVERTDSVDELSVHDGAVTSIEHKGDGIKSLVTMALIQELAQEQARGHSVILAIDEPEAHLHPASVHELQQLFQELSQAQQVLLATHNPIFVNRESVSSNILVLKNAARPAKSVAVIRDALGVALHDNLASAEIVVLVEGLTDEKAIPVLLSEVDSSLGADISAGRVVFRATKGAGKMRSQIQREKSTVCRILVVLDDDAEGREEARRIRDASVLPERNVFVLGGRTTQAELEDVVRPDVYLDALSTGFARTFKSSHFSNRSRKWSANFTAAALTLGIPSRPDLVDDAKTVVAAAIASSGEGCIKPDSMEHVTALAQMIKGTPI
ncbi:ATP-dependent endonuclease [Microbacterium sp. NPDC058062]|uniref:ATP-dependent nuclease n=1 Tax=Microbacterium sp. NPDC058062 TaxID=3346320 RepID=UPI0036DB4B31